MYSNISPGSQFNTSHNLFNVENLIAFPLFVFNIDKLAGVIPIFSASSFDGIFLLTVERSNKNTKIPTGEIEINAEEIKVLGKCKNVLPFEINSEKAGEAREDYD